MSFSGLTKLAKGVKEGISGLLDGLRDGDDLELGRYEHEGERDANVVDLSHDDNATVEDEVEEIRQVGRYAAARQPTEREQLRERSQRLRHTEASASSSRGGRRLGTGSRSEMARFREAPKKSSGGIPIVPTDPTPNTALKRATQGAGWQTDGFDEDARPTPPAAGSSSGFKAARAPLPAFHQRNGKRAEAESHWAGELHNTGRERASLASDLNRTVPAAQYYATRPTNIDRRNQSRTHNAPEPGTSTVKGKGRASNVTQAIEISEEEGEGEDDDPIVDFSQDDKPFQLTSNQAKPGKKIAAMGRKDGKKPTLGITSTPNGRGARGKDREPSPSQSRLRFTPEDRPKPRRGQAMTSLTAIEIPAKRILLSNVEVISTDERPLVCVYGKDTWTLVRRHSKGGLQNESGHVVVRTSDFEHVMREPDDVQQPSTLVVVLHHHILAKTRSNSLNEFWASLLGHVDPESTPAVLIEIDRHRGPWQDDRYDDVWDRLKMIQGQKMDRWKAEMVPMIFSINRHFTSDIVPSKPAPGGRPAPNRVPAPLVRPKPVRAAAKKVRDSGPIEVPDSPEAPSKKPERSEAPAVRRSARQSGIGPGLVLPPPRPPPEGPDSEIIAAWPPEGGPGTITLTRGDLGRLREGEFLNDTLIEFGLRYYFHSILQKTPELASRVHIFNSFFFTKLTKRASKGGNRDVEAHESVKKWTKGFDIFSKEYIVVPINEHMHWYFLIVVRPAEILRRPRPSQPSTTRTTRGSLRKGELEPIGTPKEEMPPTLSNEERKLMSPEQAHAPGLVSYRSDEDNVNLTGDSASGPAMDDQDEVDMLLDSDEEREKAARRTKEGTQEWAPIAGSSRGDVSMQDGDVTMLDGSLSMQDVDPDATVGDTDHTAMLLQGITGGALRAGSHSSTSPEPADPKTDRKANGASTRSTSPPSGAEGTADASTTVPADEIDRSPASYDREALEAPHAFSFDSLGSAHATPCKTVWKYLAQEARVKKGIEDTAHESVLNKKATVPEQPNFCDCGVYLIHAFKMFFTDPESMTQWILEKNNSDEAAKVWDSESVRSMRQEMRMVVESLREPYRKHKAKRDEEAAEAKRKRQEEKAQKKANGSGAEDRMDEDIPAPSTSDSIMERPPPAADPPAPPSQDEDDTVIVQQRTIRKYGKSDKAKAQPAPRAVKAKAEVHTIDDDDDDDDDDDPMAIKPNDAEASVCGPGLKKRNREAANAASTRQQDAQASKYFPGGPKGKDVDRRETEEVLDVEQERFEKDAAILDAPLAAAPAEQDEASSTKRQRTTSPGPRSNGRPAPMLDHRGTPGLPPVQSNVLTEGLPPAVGPPVFNGDLNPAHEPTRAPSGRRKAAHGNSAENAIALPDDDEEGEGERQVTRTRRR